MQTITLPKGRTTSIRAVDAVRELSLDKAWRIEIREHKATRSDAQLRYLWGVCYKTLGDAIGYDPEDVGEFLCGAYFGWKDKKVPKTPRNPEGLESVPIRTTTTNEYGERDVLSKTAFGEYVDFIHRFAAGKGVHIPDPEGNL